jgi:hypothetical protein
MKNDTLSNHFSLQEKEYQSHERKTEINQNDNQKNLFSINPENREEGHQACNSDINITIKGESKASVNRSFNQENDQTPDSLIAFGGDSSQTPISQDPTPKLKRKRKKRHRL